MRSIIYYEHTHTHLYVYIYIYIGICLCIRTYTGIYIYRVIIAIETTAYYFCTIIIAITYHRILQYSIINYNHHILLYND